MSNLRKIATAGGTFAVALGIGFVMQNGDALAARMGGADNESPTTAPSMPMASAGAVAVAPATIAATPQMPSAPQEPLAVAYAPDTATRSGPVAVPMASAISVVSPHLGAVVASVGYLPQAFVRGRFAAIPDMAARTTPTIAAEPETAEMPVAVALPSDIATPVMIAPDAQIVATALETQMPLESLAAPGETPTAEMPDCTPHLTGVALPGAMVGLTLVAACAPSQVVTIQHQGMMFSLLTSPEGTADVVVPALSEGAVFMADINGVDGAVAVVTVPDVALYDRAVLQYREGTGLQLHALEFGADFADEGHLWTASLDGAADGAVSAAGQFMRLGATGAADDNIVEIYSYPTGTSTLNGEIVLSVEAVVTEANCDREIAAQTLQIHPGAEPAALDLTLTMPACDAVGEYLILDSMLEDLIIASR